MNELKIKTIEEFKNEDKVEVMDVAELIVKAKDL